MSNLKLVPPKDCTITSKEECNEVPYEVCSQEPEQSCKVRQQNRQIETKCFFRKFHVSVVPALQRKNAEWWPKRSLF